MQGFEPKPDTKNLSGLFAASLQGSLMKSSVTSPMPSCS